MLPWADGAEPAPDRVEPAADHGADRRRRDPVDVGQRRPGHRSAAVARVVQGPVDRLARRRLPVQPGVDLAERPPVQAAFAVRPRAVVRARDTLARGGRGDAYDPDMYVVALVVSIVVLPVMLGFSQRSQRLKRSSNMTVSP